MTDTSVVTVLRVEGPVIDLRVRTTSAGGLDDYSTSRSFALVILADARRRARDYGTPAPSAPLPLEIERDGWPEDWYIDEAFMRESVGRYIERTECSSRRNVFRDTGPGALWGALALHEAMELSPPEQESLLLEVSHTIDLRVHVTDPKWLEGLTAGLIIPTTAFDVWFDDPLRPEPGEGTAAPSESERWRVYGMDEKYWAVRLHGSEFTVRYGKLGTKGQTKTKDVGSPDAAKREVKKLLKEKTGKGYEPLDDSLDVGESDLDD